MVGIQIPGVECNLFGAFVFLAPRFLTLWGECFSPMVIVFSALWFRRSDSDPTRQSNLITIPILQSDPSLYFYLNMENRVSLMFRKQILELALTISNLYVVLYYLNFQLHVCRVQDFWLWLLFWFRFSWL